MTQPPLTPESVVVASRQQVSAVVEGEAVILGLADGVYYGLDGVGRRVWDLIAEPRSVAELRDTVSAEYEVDASTAERDIFHLLGDLGARGLLEVVAPRAG